MSKEVFSLALPGGLHLRITQDNAPVAFAWVVAGGWEPDGSLLSSGCLYEVHHARGRASDLVCALVQLRWAASELLMRAQSDVQKAMEVALVQAHAAEPGNLLRFTHGGVTKGPASSAAGLGMTLHEHPEGTFKGQVVTGALIPEGRTYGPGKATSWEDL